MFNFFGKEQPKNLHEAVDGVTVDFMKNPNIPEGLRIVEGSHIPKKIFIKPEDVQLLPINDKYYKMGWKNHENNYLNTALVLQSFFSSGTSLLSKIRPGTGERVYAYGTIIENKEGGKYVFCLEHSDFKGVMGGATDYSFQNPYWKLSLRPIDSGSAEPIESGVYYELETKRDYSL